MKFTVRFEFGLEDVAKASTLLSARGTILQRAAAGINARMVTLLLVVIVVSATIPLIAFTPEADWLIFMGHVVATSILMVIGTTIVACYSRQRPRKQLDAIHRLGGIPHPVLQCSAELTPDGLLVTSQSGHSLLRWSSMLAPVRQDQYLLYPQTAAYAQAIPTRAFATPGELEEWWTESKRLFNDASPKAPPQSPGALGYPSSR